MLRIELGSRSLSRCDRLSRRSALRIGGLGMMGGLGLPTLMELEARGATKVASAKAVIMLFLEGGPSTIDMWDLKPDAPEEIRGPFRPIATNVAGTYVGEHCQHCARVADKYTIIRSHSHEDNGHVTGYYYVMTGERARFRDGQNSRIPANTLFPSLGSKVARELGLGGNVPSYINLPAPMDAGGAGFYGPQYAPFVIESDPAQADFAVKDLRPPRGVSAKRMSRREKLLGGIEQLQRSVDGSAAEMSTYYQKAHDLITSAEAQRAFDVRSEPESIREMYGHSTIGQSALLSRRLVEAGCRFIGVDNPGWDTHADCFPSLEKDLIPQADKAFAALVTDLEQRGMLDSTLVIMMGEMGRTPKVNTGAGRDHWGKAQSVLIAGGGIKNGQVIGATDRHASQPTTDPVSIHDLHRTIYTLMGIDTNKTYITPLGRPIPILEKGTVPRGLV